VLAVRKDLPNKCFTVGIDVPGDVTATFITTTYSTEDNHVHPTGVSFKLNYQGNSIPTKIVGAIGMQHIYPILIATAVGLARGMTITNIIEAIPTHIAPKGRMNILKGIKNSTLIDDTYNSSPDALKEGLLVLRSLAITAEGIAAGESLDVTTISDAITHSRTSRNRGGRKIAILGDMMELGKFSKEEHEKMGELAAKSCDILVTVGLRARVIRDAAIKAGMKESSIHSVDTSTEAVADVPKMVKAGDIIFIKGSQSTRLEHVTKVLLADQSKASELLVRQDPEWLAKK
jgi:UDP-N-acetylmuramyl pentapeptide synthase